MTLQCLIWAGQCRVECVRILAKHGGVGQAIESHTP